MTIFSGASGASLWLADAWTSYRSSLLSRSAGPSIQDLLDQGAATADALATISQNRTTGLASIVLQVAQTRVQAQIKALKEQALKEASSDSSSGTAGSASSRVGSAVNITA
jgi:hypothetical protein